MWAKVILTMVVETCTWMQRLKIEEYDGLTVHTWEIVMKYFRSIEIGNRIKVHSNVSTPQFSIWQ